MTGVITSLPPLIEQPPGNNSSNPAGLPGVTYVAAIPNLPQTWSALQTYLAGTLELAGTGGTSQVVKQTTLNGPLTVAQLTFADISGSIGPIQLPTPTISTLGGVFSKAAISHNFLTQIGTDGSITQAQPAFTDISGTATVSQGGIGQVTLTPHGVLLGQGTSGITSLNGTVGNSSLPLISQGASLDPVYTQLGNAGLINSSVTVGSTNIALGATAATIAGLTLTAPVMTAPALGTPASGVATNLTGTAPGLTAGTVTTNANLTGDVTSVGNAATIAANAVTNAKLATMGAFTFKGNNTSGTATPTDVSIPGLTLKASPVSADLIMIADSAAANAWKQATLSSIASAGSVASIAGNTGAFTLSGLLTNSVNVLQVVAVAKSDQTTGTSNVLAVTPLHQQDHDSACKAWVSFTGRSTNGACTIDASYNVTSVTRGTGSLYTVVFTTNFATANYACFVGTEDPSNVAPLCGVLSSSAKTVSQVVLYFENAGATVGADPVHGHLHAFGRQ